jgi:hypothetical protein
MVVFNQFRIKSIPLKYISKRDLLRIVRECGKVVDDSEDVVWVRYSWRLNLPSTWKVYVEEKDGVSDLVLENVEDPFTSLGIFAVYSGRKLLCRIEEHIEEWIRQDTPSNLPA